MQSEHLSRNLFVSEIKMQEPSLYEILIVSLPLATVPLGEATPPGHSITPHHANTEADALAACRKRVEDGYGVEVKGPNLHWDQAEALRRLNLTPSYLMSRRVKAGSDWGRDGKFNQ
jgi:hypothetical protein